MKYLSILALALFAVGCGGSLEDPIQLNPVQLEPYEPTDEATRVGDYWFDRGTMEGTFEGVELNGDAIQMRGVSDQFHTVIDVIIQKDYDLFHMAQIEIDQDLNTSLQPGFNSMFTPSRSSGRYCAGPNVGSWSLDYATREAQVYVQPIGDGARRVTFNLDFENADFVVGVVDVYPVF